MFFLSRKLAKEGIWLRLACIRTRILVDAIKNVGAFYFHIGSSKLSYLKLVGPTKTMFINMNVQH